MTAFIVVPVAFLTDFAVFSTGFSAGFSTGSADAGSGGTALAGCLRVGIALGGVAFVARAFRVFRAAVPDGGDFVDRPRAGASPAPDGGVSAAPFGLRREDFLEGGLTGLAFLGSLCGVPSRPA